MEGKNLDFNLCIICQKPASEGLVQFPTSFDKVLKFIEQWALLGEHFETWTKLKNVNKAELEEKNASWHRTCYQSIVHTGLLRRAQVRFQRILDFEQSRKVPRHFRESAEENKLTRSQTSPYDKNACFFCEKQGTYKESLHSVCTESAGNSLRAAIELANNQKLNVKLNTCVDANDAHAIDIKYHKSCWAKNVTGVLRKPIESSCQSKIVNAEVAAKIEFLNMIETELNNGKILTMADLQLAYLEILKANHVPEPTCDRKRLKQMLKSQIADIEFHQAKKVNESDRVTLKKTRDAAVQQSEILDTNDVCEEMSILFNAASILRKHINKSDRWTFTGSFDDLQESNIPKELNIFYRWLIEGPHQLFRDEKSTEVHNRVMNLAQTTICMCLSDRQRRNKTSEVIRFPREMPQQVAVGLSLHQAFRSKEMINLLHAFGMCIEYNRLLRIEAQIESAVISRMDSDGGVYIPPGIIIGRHLFFAIDNTDFKEDTRDGQNTLHGAAMAIYQQREPDDDPIPVLR